MHDQRMICRPLFGGENFSDCDDIRSIGAETVDGFGGKSDQLAGAQYRDRALDLFVCDFYVAGHVVSLAVAKHRDQLESPQHELWHASTLRPSASDAISNGNAPKVQAARGRHLGRKQPQRLFIFCGCLLQNDIGQGKWS